MTTTYIKDVIGTDFITGFKMTWENATSLTISSGAAALPSGRFIVSNSNITLSGMTLAASTWYHLHLASATSIEYSTTEPAAPYFGTARTKTGDATRRYLGSFSTDGSGNIYKFIHAPQTGIISYNVSTPNILSAGSATTKTAVSTAGIAPLTATALQIVVIAGSSVVYIVNNADEWIYYVPANTRIVVPFAKNELYYRNASSGGSTYIAVYGYSFER